MKFGLGIILLLSTLQCVHAEDSANLVARLIAQTWKPQIVRVEWKSRGSALESPSEYDDWKIGENRPNRMAGAMIVVLERKEADGNVEKIPISGTAHIFGPSLTPMRRLTTGQTVDSLSLEQCEKEWTRLSSDAATWMDISKGVVAVRTLVPGRPITVADIKPTPVVHRDQSVDLQYVDGSVRIKMAGRALQDGAVGETITVAVEMGKPRRFEGTVAEDGTVQIAR